MGFFKSKGSMLAAAAGLLVLAGAIWFVLGGSSRQTMPEGTLVRRHVVEAVL